MKKRKIISALAVSVLAASAAVPAAAFADDSTEEAAAAELTLPAVELTDEGIAIGDEEVKDVDAYIKHLYTAVFGREPSESELEKQNVQMKIGVGGAKILTGLLTSDEYTAENKLDSSIIPTVFNALLFREPTEEENAKFVEDMYNGFTWQYVVQEVSNLDEYVQLCEEYGAKSGKFVSGDIVDTNPDVKDFVIRLYSTCLGRRPDTSGLHNWVYRIVIQRNTAAQTVRGFYNSTEFKEKKLSNDELICTLYSTLLDRTPSQSEIDSWSSKLAMGVTNDYLLRGFVASSEFSNICKESGIERGDIVLTDPRDMNLDLTSFCSRMYTCCLGRSFDANGLTGWVAGAADGKYTAADIVRGFFGSTEFKNRKLSDEEFIRTLYVTILDREPTEAEVTNWVTKRRMGVTDTYFLYNFVGSPEFSKLCSKFGIVRGNITLTDIRDKNLDITSFCTRMYTCCLGRNYDPVGLTNWVTKVTSGEYTAADVVKGFFNSSEFKNKGLSDEEFVTTLYQTLFNRTPSASEINTWVTRRNSGVSDTYMLYGFVGSAEFKNLCDKYGMTKGSITLTQVRDKNPLIAGFVVNAYKNTGLNLGENFINTKVQNILNGKNGYEFLSEVFQSKEYDDLKPSNEQFAKDVTQAVYGREGTTKEQDEVLALLKAGKSRADVVDKLTDKEEFTKYCESVGIRAKGAVYPLAAARLDQIGWNLKAAFDWSSSLTYYGHTADMPQTSATSMEWYAEYGFKNLKGNCYVMAATFCEMAKTLGYECSQISGSVPLLAGGYGPHSWCEITIDGEVYVCDPDFTNETGRNGYLIKYGQSGTWIYKIEDVMS